MKIEAVTTCVGYADILAHTLPLLKQHFEHIIVVTAPEDHDTRRVCEAWNVHSKATDAFMSRWGLFCKGGGINEGLKLLDCDGWVAHVDADIVLPPHFRATLEAADLDPEFIYGIDRQMFRSYEQWRQFLENPQAQVEEQLLIHPARGAELGARVMYPSRGGWMPIGFFQLWNPSASGIRSYHANETSANRDDSMFGSQWPRRKRALIPEIVAYHLESEPAPMGHNWSGRRTKPFRHA